jgi:hypothetical protein
MMDDKIAFRQRMEAELQAWETELEHWSRQNERAEGDVELRREQQQMLDDLHEKRMQARHYLDDLDRGGDWNALRPKMEPLWADIRRSIEAIKVWA